MLRDIVCGRPSVGRYHLCRAGQQIWECGGLSWGSIGDGRGQQEVVGAAVVVIRNKYAIVADQLFG